MTRGTLFIGGLWLGSVALGMGLLMSYSFAAGASADAPAGWPAASKLQLAKDRPTLVLVAHPHCSCTRASIAELARLMTRLSGQLEGYMVFIKPEGLGDGWEVTDLWESACSSSADMSPAPGISRSITNFFISYSLSGCTSARGLGVK